MMRWSTALRFSSILLFYLCFSALAPHWPYSQFVLLGVWIGLVHFVGALSSLYGAGERYYDICGSISFLGANILVYYFQQPLSIPEFILWSLLNLWTIRMGVFLFARILYSGGDRRFDTIKKHPDQLLLAWGLSAVWVYTTASPIWLCLLAPGKLAWTAIFTVGCIVWWIGFCLEVVSDWQKWQFKSQKQSLPFISTGLWAYSQHPNYAGEILMWWAAAIMSAAQLSGIQLLSLLTPCGVMYLLIAVSGIPLLDKRAQDQYGDLPAYHDYYRRTAKLFPGIW